MIFKLFGTSRTIMRGRALFSSGKTSAPRFRYFARSKCYSVLCASKKTRGAVGSSGLLRIELGAAAIILVHILDDAHEAPEEALHVAHRLVEILLARQFRFEAGGERIL